ncbi:DoxX family membrane protein [Fodinicola feengrottensis]|uniref:DoxX family membrane protein n=1 Tax=Fodinicola feengrottensis TaxID=435914 RepID=A0ABN2FXF2_9ACTN
MTQVSVQRPAGRTAWWPATQPWLSTVLRLALAVIWILAAWPKVTDLDNNIRSVRAYELGIPDTLVQVIGIGQPFLELVLGLLLIVGLGVRLMSAASALLFVIYIVGIISVWVRGLRIDCGCFSSGGQLAAGVDPQYAIEIARDLGFVAIAVVLVIWPLSKLSVDGLIRHLSTSGLTAADLADGDEDEENE